MYQTLNILKQNSPWIIKKKQKEKENEKRHKCKHCHIKKVFYIGGVWNLLFSTFLVFWWNVGNDVYATAIKKIVHGISPENKNHSQTRCGWRKKSSADWKSLSLHNWPDCFCAWEFWQQSHKKWVSPPYSPHGFTARPLPKLCGPLHFQSCQLRKLKIPPPPTSIA